MVRTIIHNRMVALAFAGTIMKQSNQMPKGIWTGNALRYCHNEHKGGQNGIIVCHNFSESRSTFSLG